jgi:hypothetical protein
VIVLVPEDARDHRRQDLDAPTGVDGVGYLRRGPDKPIGGRATTSLPADLLSQAAGRLRILALLYAFTFFMAAFFPALLPPDGRQMIFAHPIHWAPGAISIAVALSVAWVVGISSLSPRATMAGALVFEIASCYGIAASEFLQPGLDFRGPGLDCRGLPSGRCSSTSSSRPGHATPFLPRWHRSPPSRS